jgi:hypothetical protein
MPQALEPWKGHCQDQEEPLRNALNSYPAPPTKTASGPPPSGSCFSPSRLVSWPVPFHDWS